MVERDLAKVEVAGSKPVSRSSFCLRGQRVCSPSAFESSRFALFLTGDGAADTDLLRHRCALSLHCKGGADHAQPRSYAERRGRLSHQAGPVRPLAWASRAISDLDVCGSRIGVGRSQPPGLSSDVALFSRDISPRDGSDIGLCRLRQPFARSRRDAPSRISPGPPPLMHMCSADHVPLGRKGDDSHPPLVTRSSNCSCLRQMVENRSGRV